MDSFNRNSSFPNFVPFFLIWFNFLFQQSLKFVCKWITLKFYEFSIVLESSLTLRSYFFGGTNKWYKLSTSFAVLGKSTSTQPNCRQSGSRSRFWTIVAMSSEVCTLSSRPISKVFLNKLLLHRAVLMRSVAETLWITLSSTLIHTVVRQQNYRTKNQI